MVDETLIEDTEVDSTVVERPNIMRDVVDNFIDDEEQSSSSHQSESNENE